MKKRKTPALAKSAQTVAAAAKQPSTCGTEKTSSGASDASAQVPHQSRQSPRMKFITRDDIVHTWATVFGNKTTPPIRAYVDAGNQWTVQVFPTTDANGTPWEGMLRVGIAYFKNPGKPKSQCEILHSWSVIQSVKESIFPGRLAIEVYPPESQVVDAAPMRWLWILPAGARLPLCLSTNYRTIG